MNLLEEAFQSGQRFILACGAPDATAVFPEG